MGGSEIVYYIILFANYQKLEILTQNIKNIILIFFNILSHCLYVAMSYVEIMDPNHNYRVYINIYNHRVYINIYNYRVYIYQLIIIKHICALSRLFESAGPD